MTIVLLQLFSRDTTRWIKVTDCGTSHWASHAMSLSLSRSPPPSLFFFISLSLSLFLLFLCLLHLSCTLASMAQQVLRLRWWLHGLTGDEQRGLRAWLLLAFWNFLKQKHTSALLPHTCHFGTPLELIFSPKQIYRGLQSNFRTQIPPRPRASFGTVRRIQCFVKAQKKWSWQSICFQKEMQRTSLGPETDETADSWALTVAQKNQKSDWILRSS